MRSTLVSAVACSFALFTTGCGGDTAADKKVQDAKAKISEAGSATLEAAKAKRDEYLVEMGKQMDHLNVKYKELKAKAEAAAPEAKKNMEQLLEEAKVKRDDAAKKLEELKSAGADRWEKIKVGVGDAVEDLKKSLK